MGKRVLLTGASGFVGQTLGRALTARGDRVIAVSRSGASKLSFPAEQISWDALGTVGRVDAVVHLAGETVAQRWTEDAKKKIFESRVASAQKIRASGLQMKVFVSASGVGFYGNRGDEILTENSSSGNDFLATVCLAWEAAALAFESVGARPVALRFGLVMGKGGGALAKMVTPFKLGLGGKLGNGKQWLSWIHLDDLVAMIMRAVDDEKIEGVYNAVAPDPVRNAEFSKELARVFGKRTFLPVPAFALKAAMGEMSNMMLGGQRAVPARWLELGGHFKYPKIFAALKASVGK